MSETLGERGFVMIATALAMLSSAVKCGEQWSDLHEKTKAEALVELARIGEAIAAAYQQGHDARREADARIARELLDMAKIPAQRLAYAIVERAILRGRNLTARERMENLARFLEEETDPEIAAAIRSAP